MEARQKNTRRVFPTGVFPGRTGSEHAVRRAVEEHDGLATAEERDRAIASHFNVILEAVHAGRAELVRLHRAGQIDDETLHDLEHDLDLEELGAISLV